MRIPNPVFILQMLRRSYAYFRTGVAVEGEAWLCPWAHAQIFVPGGSTKRRRISQHIHVKLRFWNRRTDPVTVLEIVNIDLPLRTVVLTEAAWQPFHSVTLEAGAAPQTREFVLVPKGAPEGRVEASTGDLLDLEFRPSRGSERWARPRLRLSIRVR